MAFVYVDTIYPHCDEHAHRPDLMERLAEIRAAAEEQGVDLPEGWRDHVDMPEAVRVSWVYDTDTGNVSPSGSWPAREVYD